MRTAMYESPLGSMLLAAEEDGLGGAWFTGQRYFPDYPDAQSGEGDGILMEACAWLDEYFAGREPDFMPPLHLTGTDFQRSVWNVLLKIPYGGTRTYGDIAGELSGPECHRSARAVGGAVGRNRISIFVPCHRVVGADGGLTGYAGGLRRKAALLALERGRTQT